MGPTIVSSKKRKAVVEDAPAQDSFPQEVGLELDSEEEMDEELSDDEEVEAFPEIDVKSDSGEEDDGNDDDEDEDEDEDEEEGEEDEEEDEEDEEENEGDEDELSSEDISDDVIGIFPVAKTVFSDITGQPKRVYPNIEPNYDSDSSTEDVSSFHCNRNK